jgi:hypothetical protein
LFGTGVKVALFDPWVSLADDNFFLWHIVSQDSSTGFDGFLAGDTFLNEVYGAGRDDFLDIIEICRWTGCAWFLGCLVFVVLFSRSEQLFLDPFYQKIL